MGGCCCKRQRGQEKETYVGAPSPSCPQYDSEGFAVEASPVSGARRRLQRTRSSELPALG